MSEGRVTDSKAYLAYILPYAWFGVVLGIGKFVTTQYARYWAYVIAYAGALALLLWFRSLYDELDLFKLTPREWGLGILVGAVAIAVWILPYHFFVEQMRSTDSVFGKLGSPRPPFIPGQVPGFAGASFFAFRIVAYCFITPFFEELFVRSFLIRYLVNDDFRSVEIAKYTPLSFWFTVAWFSLSHPEWVVAAAYAVILNLLLYRTRKFSCCVVAHIVSNMALVAYVFATKSWYLW